MGLCPSPAWGSLPEWQWAAGLVDSGYGKMSVVLPLKRAVRSFIHKLSPGASPLGRFPSLPRLNLFPESQMCSLLSLYGDSSIYDAKGTSPGGHAPETSTLPMSVALVSLSVKGPTQLCTHRHHPSSLSILLSHFHRVILGCCYELHTLC